MIENKAELSSASQAKEGAKVAGNGLAFIGLGFFMLLIPVIGWVVGGIMIMLGLIGLVNSPIVALTVDTYEGLCPYCEGNTKVSIDRKMLNEVTGHNCLICRKRFVFRNNHFCAIE